jgi:hypothetical protein
MAGTTPLNTEQLKRSVRKGARMSTFSLSSFVGSGSLAQLLSGSDRTAAAATLSTLSGRSSKNEVCSDRGEFRRWGTINRSTNIVDLVLKLTVELFSADIFRCRSATAFEKCIDRSPQLPRSCAFGISHRFPKRLSLRTKKATVDSTLSGPGGSCIGCSGCSVVCVGGASNALQTSHTALAAGSTMLVEPRIRRATTV